MSKMKENLEEMFPAQTITGGYPFIYLNGRSDIVCNHCAQEHYLETNEKFFKIIHWEGPKRNCEVCNCELESAYGNPKEEN